MPSDHVSSGCPRYCSRAWDAQVRTCRHPRSRQSSGLIGCRPTLRVRYVKPSSCHSITTLQRGPGLPSSQQAAGTGLLKSECLGAQFPERGRPPRSFSSYPFFLGPETAALEEKIGRRPLCTSGGLWVLSCFPCLFLHSAAMNAQTRPPEPRVRSGATYSSARLAPLLLRVP